MRRIAVLFYYLSFYPVRSVVLVISILLCAVFELASLSLFVPIIEYIQQGGTVTETNRIMAVIMGVLDYWNMQPTLAVLLGFAFIATAMQFVTLFAQNALTAYLFFPVRKRIRDRCFENLMDSSLTYFAKRKTGDLVNIMNERIDTVGYAISLAVQILADAVLIAAYLVFMLFISWPISLMVFAVAVLKHFATMIFVVRSKKIGEDWLREGNEQVQTLVEDLNGIRLIKSLSREDHEKKRFASITGRFSDTQVRSAMNQETLRVFDNLLGPLLFVGIIYVSIEVFHVSGSLVLIYIFALMKMVPKLTKINVNRNQLNVNLANTEAILDLLNPDNKPRVTAGDRSLTALHSEIAFDKVSFAYRPDVPVLQDVSFQIKKGECVAVVGSSGSGKSTLVNLLLHLYDPHSGRILIDGIDLREFTTRSWHDRVGFVDQDTFIFNDTVANNIRYGRLEASEKDVMEAAQKAHIHDTIRGLDKGYETELGERGIKLSGGQRQRIAIARAIIKKPEILIFDEATSALDSISEELVRESIEELSRTCTTVLIAHRLSTIRHADRILVLEDGRLVESGSHPELYAMNGRYRAFYDMQHKHQAQTLDQKT